MALPSRGVAGATSSPRPSALVLLAIVVIGVAAAGAPPRRTPAASSRPPAPDRGGASARSARDASGTASAAIRRLLALGLPIYCGGPRGNAVAFTFDDGPGIYTHDALKKLASAHERATFFVVGRSVDNWPGYLRRELKVAAVEDHTYTHVALISLTPSQINYQLRATAEMIAADTGEHVRLWRPPYELHNPTVDRIAHQLGLLDVLWDVDSRDSLGANFQIIKNVEAGLRPGAIIEMHENRGQTIRALTALLPALRHRHLRSVSVPELLASDPPSPQQVRQGLPGCQRDGAVLRRGLTG